MVDTNDNTFTYLWVMGDSTTYTTATVTHTYMDSDDRVITLTVKDPTGHSGTDSISLDVNAAPTVTFTMDVGDGRINPDEAIIFTSTATEPDGDALTYDWRVNGTNFSTLANPTNTFTTPGTYTILLTVTDTRGAQGSDTAVVTVNAPPMASFSTNSNYTVEAGSISFTNTSTDTEDSSLDYNWNFGDGGSSSSASPSHTYNAYGSYTVTLTVTDDDDLTDNATTVIEVNALPVAAITETPSENKVDMGASFTLKGNTSSDPDDSIVSYLWTMSDNTTYTTANITHTFSTNADGDITLQVTDEDGETGTATYTISVNGAPVADFSQDKVLINPGGTVSFTANATDPDSDTLNYSWNFGDGNTGTGVSPTHAYANTGDYTVVLTVSDGRLNTVVTKINLIHVNAAPIANAGVDQTLDYSTNGSTVYLNGSASSDAEGQTLTYLWTFETLPSESLLDNGDIAGPASASPSFDISGESAAARASITGTLVYILDLQVTDSLGETDQDQVTITISGTGAINVIIE